MGFRKISLCDLHFHFPLTPLLTRTFRVNTLPLLIANFFLALFFYSTQKKKSRDETLNFCTKFQSLNRTHNTTLNTARNIAHDDI